jgi:hypothetical protein
MKNLSKTFKDVRINQIKDTTQNLKPAIISCHP